MTDSITAKKLQQLDKDISYLKPALKQHNLVDLHTHLLGMGDVDFWMSQVKDAAKTPLLRPELAPTGLLELPELSPLEQELAKRPFWRMENMEKVLLNVPYLLRMTLTQDLADNGKPKNQDGWEEKKCAVLNCQGKICFRIGSEFYCRKHDPDGVWVMRKNIYWVFADEAVSANEKKFLNYDDLVSSPYDTHEKLGILARPLNEFADGLYDDTKKPQATCIATHIIFTLENLYTSLNGTQNNGDDKANVKELEGEYQSWQGPETKSRIAQFADTTANVYSNFKVGATKFANYTGVALSRFRSPNADAHVSSPTPYVLDGMTRETQPKATPPSGEKPVENPAQFETKERCMKLKNFLMKINCTPFDVRKYVIWNERKGMPETVLGIPAPKLWANLSAEVFKCDHLYVDQSDLKQNAEKAKRNIRQCFEMLGLLAKEPANPTESREKFQGNFQPEFLPKRYNLKDDLYGQRLEYLEKLLDWALKRYYEAGVGYVELSIGVNDATSEFVSRYLRGSYNDGINKQGVLVRYLAMFRRDLPMDLPKPLKDLSIDPPKPFNDKCNSKDLKKLALVFQKSTQDLYKSQDEELMRNLIVGLDWAGPELGYPGCGFKDDRFVTFVLERWEEERQSRNVGKKLLSPSFGLRIHSGEWVVYSPLKKFKEHLVEAMKDIQEVVKKLKTKWLEKMAKMSSDKSEELVGNEKFLPPVRIGHGIWFGYGLTAIENFQANSNLAPAESLVQEIKDEANKFFEMLSEYHIPAEVCMTSNDKLLDLVEDRKIHLCNFFRSSENFKGASGKHRIVLSTDDDGIFRCETKFDGEEEFDEFRRSVHSEYLLFSSFLIESLQQTVDSVNLIVQKTVKFGLEARFYKRGLEEFTLNEEDGLISKRDMSGAQPLQ